MLGTTLLRDVFLHSVAILCLLAGLLASASTVLASPAGGADMQFLVVRSNQPGCEPTCPEWISAEGTIVRESPTHLKKLLKAIGDRRLPIVVTSLGGDVDAAMVLGRIIRARKLEVAVGKTRFVGCQPRLRMKGQPQAPDGTRGMGVAMTSPWSNRLRSADGNLGRYQLSTVLLLTSELPVGQLVDADICRGTPAPDNCRVFTTMDLE